MTATLLYERSSYICMGSAVTAACSIYRKSACIAELQSKVSPMPCGKHDDTLDENKLVCSDGSIGTFVPALHGSSTVALGQQASKRSLEDREDGGELE